MQRFTITNVDIVQAKALNILTVTCTFILILVDFIVRLGGILRLNREGSRDELCKVGDIEAESKAYVRGYCQESYGVT